MNHDEAPATIEPIPHTPGCFRFIYHINLNDPHNLCDCAAGGWADKRHTKPCRHIAAVLRWCRAAKGEGVGEKLPAPPAPYPDLPKIL